jgi:energy-coupling factor transporter ATP-binding protein EcfA2
MEIGGGLQPEMTGTENIRLLSSLYGLSEAESQARLPEVASFAALGRFINAPVKSYSQGMLMRLAFAIAIHIDADILLIDDTFSVGDAYAQKKCLNRIFELRERGTTILCVSHDLEMVRRLCGRGIFLRDGRVVMDGPIEKVSRFYTETVGDRRGIAILENGDACCVFNNGGLMFRWKGESFTARPMESSFRLGGRNYFSQAAQWEAARVPGGRGILATGRWPERGVRQSWKIDIAESGGFDICVSVDTPEPPEVSETRIFLSKEFTRWSSLSRDNEFAADFEFEKSWNISLVEDPDNRFIMAGGDAVPGVAIDRSADFAAECDAGNTGADTGARILQFRRHGRSQRGATGWQTCPSVVRGARS